MQFSLFISQVHRERFQVQVFFVLVAEMLYKSQSTTTFPIVIIPKNSTKNSLQHT